MKRALPLLAIALTACATMPAPAAGPTAGLGQVATVGGMQIRPIAIVEDSRCPMNVRCVWAGRLIILAEVQYRGGSEEFRGNMTLGQPLRLGSRALTLVSAVPEKMAGTRPRPRQYRFTFAVEP